MVNKKVTGSSRLAIPRVPILPCVLQAWLESTKIPYPGNTLARPLSYASAEYEYTSIELFDLGTFCLF
jgi:hypothetical protein